MLYFVVGRYTISLKLKAVFIYTFLKWPFFRSCLGALRPLSLALIVSIKHFNILRIHPGKLWAIFSSPRPPTFRTLAVS